MAVSKYYRLIIRRQVLPGHVETFLFMAHYSHMYLVFETGFCDVFTFVHVFSVDYWTN